MDQAQQYMDMARQAAEQKGHVATVVFNGLGALVATSVEESVANVEALIEYGNVPKRSIDQLATYHLAQYAVTVRSLGGALDTRIRQLIENLRGSKDATA